VGRQGVSRRGGGSCAAVEKSLENAWTNNDGIYWQTNTTNMTDRSNPVHPLLCTNIRGRTKAPTVSVQANAYNLKEYKNKFKKF
jgi:hypothetical protein